MHNLIVPGGTHVVSLLSDLIKVAPNPSELNTDVTCMCLNQRCHLRIPGVRWVTCRKFHTEHSQILGATVKNVVTTATWRQGFVHLWSKHHATDPMGVVKKKKKKTKFLLHRYQPHLWQGYGVSRQKFVVNFLRLSL
jgi:hypothetical protein